MMRREGRRTASAVVPLVLAVLLILAGCGTGTSPASATPTIPTDAPVIEGAWARPAPAGGNSALYLTLQNPTDREVRLVGVSTDVAQAVETHETVQDANGVLRMEPRPEGFSVAPGETLVLKPGGKHIMLLNLKQPLEVGQSITLSLTLEDARGQVTTELSVPVQEGPGMETGSMEGMEHASEGTMGGMEMPAGSMPADALAPRLSDNGLFRVSARPQIDPVTVGPIHAWVIHVETADGRPVTDAQIQVSGGMPAHQHGFPTTPRVTQNLDNGDYLLEGMKFSMAGMWNLTLEITAGGQTDTVTFEFELK